MSETPVLEGWIFQITPEPGESFGHYLGRFRRANCLSRAGLAELFSITSMVVRGWEMPSLGGSSSAEQLAKISVLMGLSVAQLEVMLPGERSQMHLSTRLCSACYVNLPVHQSCWQRAGVDACDRHHQPFLTACPSCGTGFRLPALWEDGCCERCWLPFSDMQDLEQTELTAT